MANFGRLKVGELLEAGLIALTNLEVGIWGSKRQGTTSMPNFADEAG